MTTARSAKLARVVAGVFEIREQAGDSITVTSLGDDRTYRIQANAGPAALAPMRPGCFMTARIVPVGDGWMLSGAQQLYAASERPACSGWPPNEAAPGAPDPGRYPLDVSRSLLIAFWLPVPSSSRSGHRGTS